MMWLCKTDADGFIVSLYSSEEFSTSGVAAPETEPPHGFVWRRIADEWVAHEDRRGSIYFDPASPAGELNTFVVSNLLDLPPPGWELYGDEQRQQDGLHFASKVARSRRQQLLLDSDWTDTLSAPGRLGEALYQEWQSYRQHLRDITEQPGFPMTIDWGTPPS